MMVRLPAVLAPAVCLEAYFPYVQCRLQGRARRDGARLLLRPVPVLPYAIRSMQARLSCVPSPVYGLVNLIGCLSPADCAARAGRAPPGRRATRGG